MKRTALLIGSSLPVNDQDHLQGVAEDISNNKKFLLSANGGAWEEHEIIELHDPTSKDIAQAKYYQSQSDYALTMYSGHGNTEDGKTFLDINQSQEIYFKDLFVETKWNLIVMDACRNDYAYEHAEGIFGLGLEFEDFFKNVSRKIYESAISKTPYGRAVIFSTGIGEVAWDTEDGGAFTIELLSQTINWVNENSELYLPIGRAFTRAKNCLQKYSQPQSPQIHCTSQNLVTLPFATNPKILMGSRNYRPINNPLSKNQSKPRGMSIYIVS